MQNGAQRAKKFSKVHPFKNMQASCYIDFSYQISQECVINYFLFMPSPNKRLSPEKNSLANEQNLKLSPVKQFHQKLYTKDYFCHYSNGIYMGGMDCFKKLGHGVLLLDNGTCAVTCHSHDNMINHNVIFSDGSMTSIIVGLTKAKIICYRSGPFLLYFKMSPANNVEGIGFFIHYRHRKLFRLKFQNDDISIKQRIVDPVILRKVFDENDLSQLIQESHCKALKMKFQLPPYIRYQKNGEKFIFGIAQPQSKETKFLGLCFKIVVKQALSDFDVYLEERGCLKNNKIENFGQRHFDNGNYYIGEFKEDKFQGRGILVYPKQNKWTSGYFTNGQLQEVVESSINNPNINCPSAIKKIHQYSKPYIQQSIRFVPTSKWLHSLIKVIDDKDPYEHESIDYTKQQNEAIQNLNIVNQDYVNRKYENRTQQALKKLTGQVDKSKSKSKNKKEPLIKKLSPVVNKTKKSPIRDKYNNSPEPKSVSNNKKRYIDKGQRSNEYQQDKNKEKSNKKANNNSTSPLKLNQKQRSLSGDRGSLSGGDKSRSRAKQANPISIKENYQIPSFSRSNTEKNESNKFKPTISPKAQAQIARTLTGQNGLFRNSPSKQTRYPEPSPIHHLQMPKDHHRVFYDPIRALSNPYSLDYGYLPPPPPPPPPANYFRDSRLTAPISNTYLKDPLLLPPLSYPIVPRRDPLFSGNSYEPYLKIRDSPDREYGRRKLFKYLEQDQDYGQYSSTNRLSNRAYRNNLQF